MIKFALPRVLIAASGSGAGKTTIVCGILKALKNRGKKVISFKCGPDYIDPMFHSKAIDTPSSNLDLFFTDKNTVRYLMHQNKLDNYGGESELAIIEGVMGYYDGLAGVSTEASAFDLAQKTDTPTILIVDGRGKSLSVLAEIKGFLEFRKNSNIVGVILNKMSSMMAKELKPIIESELGIRVIGNLPKLENVVFESRHLGLVTADEIGNINDILNTLAEEVEKNIDIDILIDIAQNTKDIEYKDIEIKHYEKVRIGYALDKVFCFYYSDNLRLLEKMGAELIPFSPLLDNKLPDNLDGIILGGGYPELYMEELSENKSFIESLKNNVEKGIPLIAECGGYMYLHKSVEVEGGKVFDGVGVIEAKTYPIGKLSRFGYIDVVMEKDTLLGDKGTFFKAHEFHYWDSTMQGDSCIAKKPMRNRSWKCVVSKDNIFAGYPHIHFYSNLDIAEEFIKKSVGYRLRI